MTDQKDNNNFKPSHRLLNPDDGTEVFGVVPALKLGHFLTEEAPIYLNWGRHSGPNRGGGVVHIWAEHQADMLKLDLKTIHDVPAYVRRIVRSGTSLHYEAGRMRGNERTSAVRASAGTAILEYIQGEPHAYWRIITAFSTPKRIGTAVGRIK